MQAAMTQKDIFPLSISQAKAVSGLELPALKFLCKERLVPVGGGGGHGHKLEFDDTAMVYCCAIAAMKRVGIGIKAAGRLLKAMREDDLWPAYVLLLRGFLNPPFPGFKHDPEYDIFLEIIDGTWLFVRMRPDLEGPPLILVAGDQLMLGRAVERVVLEKVLENAPAESMKWHQAKHARRTAITKLTINLSAYCRLAASRLS